MRRPAILGCYVVATLCLAVLMLVGWLLIKALQGAVAGGILNGRNCWSFAIPKWLRQPRETYLVIDMSRHAKVAHVRFAPSIDGLYVEELKPSKPQRGLKGLLDSLWFAGRIRKDVGDK
jgi:hypothetical protein